MSESKRLTWFQGQTSFNGAAKSIYEGDAFRNRLIATAATEDAAQLIAAAPAMLAMLRECRATFAFAASDGDVTANDFIAEIDAVLDKAEGRS